MKIIFSRKGFDSSLGKIPSPIFSSGEMFSLPIPSQTEGSVPYSKIGFNEHNIGQVVNDLTFGKIGKEETAHFDPDLEESCVPRSRFWKPIFGQSGAAQGHLFNNGIEIGDLFIFYGWFQKCYFENNTYFFRRTDSSFHAIFGWLQIGSVLSVFNREQVPSWAYYHPHMARTPTMRNDTIYISNSALVLPGISKNGMAGAGLVKSFNENLVLSAPGENKSTWRLPKWFFPDGIKPILSYHHNSERWAIKEEFAILDTVGRGQEFVLDCNSYPEAIEWVHSILSSSI